MPPCITILIRRGEAPHKCTVRPLRGRPGLEFMPYPLKHKPDFSRHLLLAPDGPPLHPADAGRSLLLLDASWRHAATMRQAVEPIQTRSIPVGWQTAYPRSSKIHTDPAAGLATVEALYAALLTLGHRDDTLLHHYPWHRKFLEINRALIQPTARP